LGRDIYGNFNSLSGFLEVFLVLDGSPNNNIITRINPSFFMIISHNFTPAIFFGNQLIKEICHKSAIKLFCVKESLFLTLNGI